MTSILTSKQYNMGFSCCEFSWCHTNVRIVYHLVKSLVCNSSLLETGCPVDHEGHISAKPKPSTKNQKSYFTVEDIQYFMHAEDWGKWSRMNSGGVHAVVTHSGGSLCCAHALRNQKMGPAGSRRSRQSYILTYSRLKIEITFDNSRLQAKLTVTSASTVSH